MFFSLQLSGLVSHQVCTEVAPLAGLVVTVNVLFRGFSESVSVLYSLHPMYNAFLLYCVV